MFNRLLGVAGVLALLAAAVLVSPQRGRASGTDNVRVVNGIHQPALIRNVNDAFQPVEITVPVGPFIATDPDGHLAAFTVPPHKRFVLEDVSASAEVPSGEKVLDAAVSLTDQYTVVPGSPVVFVPMTFAGPSLTPGLDSYRGGRVARGYANPGDTVAVFVERNTSGTAGGNSSVTISGYLADL